MKETYNKIVNNKAFQIVKKLLSICLTVVLVLVFFIILVQKLSNNRFNLGGYGIYTIATGSMEPEYKVKDLILSNRVDPKTINVGDDVVYLGKEDSLNGKIITHRVVDKYEKDGKVHFYTQGIASGMMDPEIDESQVLGVVKHKLHILSFLSHIINSTYGLIFLIIIPFIVFVFFEGKRIIDESHKED
jgi:signal peptidase I